MNLLDDPIGAAILEFSQNKKSSQIIVESDLCDDDIIESSYLFRSYDELPELEKKALSLVKGKTLDVGACAGCHSIILQDKNFKVVSLDTSSGAIDHMKSQGLETIHSRISEFKGQSFDTILILMNGLGLAETLSQLPGFLNHLKSLLNPGGSILCDSSDIKYLYEDEDGAIWVDLNSSYYGEMKFNMKFKEFETGWFNWLYVDSKSLIEVCNDIGLECQIIRENEDHQYLAQIK